MVVFGVISLYCKTGLSRNILFDGGMKSSFDVFISAVDDFTDRWDPNNATPMEELCGRQGGLC